MSVCLQNNICTWYGVFKTILTHIICRYYQFTLIVSGKVLKPKTNLSFKLPIKAVLEFTEVEDEHG